MKKILLTITPMILMLQASQANARELTIDELGAKNQKQVLQINGYTLHNCSSDVYSDDKEKVTKNYCKKDKADLQKIFNIAKNMKPNFNGDKKLVTYKYKNKVDWYVTDIFVFDDKNKKVYLQPNYAEFDDEVTKSPSIVSNVKLDFFCLYEKDSKFSTSYAENTPMGSPKVETNYNDDSKFDLVCSSYSTKYDFVFSSPCQLFYDDYKGTDIEAFVNKFSK